MAAHLNSIANDTEPTDPPQNDKEQTEALPILNGSVLPDRYSAVAISNHVPAHAGDERASSLAIPSKHSLCQLWGKK